MQICLGKSAQLFQIEILNKTDIYIDFKVKSNKKDNIRIQIVTILIENEIYCTFEIRQRLQEKLFFESKPLLIIDASKNQYEIKVTSNINYETALLNDAEEWIAIKYADGACTANHRGAHPETVRRQDWIDVLRRYNNLL